MPLQPPKPNAKRRPRLAASQRGVTLLFALLALVTLLLTTLALVRSVDTATLLLGNLGFKKDATASADKATREAVNWLTLNNAVLNTSDATKGYYASTQELASDGTTVQAPVDVTGQQLASTNTRQLVDWDANTCQSTSSASYTSCAVKPASASAMNGNNARYVIFRLCNKAGDYETDPSINCAKPIANSGNSASGRGSLDYSSMRFTGTAGPYYRIVVRVLGARNTASFTETIVHF